MRTPMWIKKPLIVSLIALTILFSLASSALAAGGASVSSAGVSAGQPTSDGQETHG